MILKREDAINLTKHGVRMWIYPTPEEFDDAAVAYQETEKGHTQEFYHEKSAFVFYIIEGQGTWFIEDREYPVEATDVVIVPPGKKFYYKGNLKQICVTVPAWEAEYERHVRFMDL